METSEFMLAFATAADTASAIRAGRISAREVVHETFERIERHNPALNAITWMDRARAMARARQADETLAAGKAVGALHGVPITIKDGLAYRGSPNAWGLPALGQAVSPRTAIAVERLEAAGAIVVGKTNVPVMLADWQAYNPIHGTTNNPWDLTRTPGGSTGGGAAAVAAGLGCVTIGSDLSGSLRIPAHFCGVYAHKPSLNLVSTAGFQPGPWDGTPGYPVDLAVVGPMTRSAQDLALTLEVTGGADGENARAWSWRLPPPRHRRLGDFRIGCVPDDDIAPIASDVRTSYEQLLSALASTGAKVDDGWPAGIDPAAQVETFQYLLFAFLAMDADREDQERARQRLRTHPDDIAAAAAVEPHARWLHESRRRSMFQAAWQQYFERHDVFLLPTSITAAFPHDHSTPMERRTIATPEGRRPYLPDIATWTTFATVAGLPATVAPIARTAAGLPVGVQIVAPMWEDGTGIEFAGLLSEITGGFTPPPMFSD